MKTLSSGLQQHTKSVHECVTYKICDYQSTQKSVLSQQVKNVHQKSENINCTEYNKSIQRRGLSQHMKKFHTGEQTNFECNICTFKTIHKYSLYTHVKFVRVLELECIMHHLY